MQKTNGTTKLLVAVVVLQGLMVIGQWAGAPSMMPAAQAQLRNSGEDRAAMLEQLQAVNGKLDKIAGILESGKLQVEVAKSDDKDRKAAPSR